MAVNKTWIAAPPDRVFAVLADPRTYADWVVGAAETRDFDREWPRPGTVFHHTQLIPRIGLRDTTAVVACERPRRLLLETRLRAFAKMSVDLRLEPADGGTFVTMREIAVGGLAGMLPAALLDPAIHLRNREGLRRLRRIAERT